MQNVLSMTKQNRPADITALSLFFVFGAALCALCGFAILLRGSELHPFWSLIPALAIMGTEATSWLVFVGLASIAAALGLWRCSYWGFLTAMIVLCLFVATHFLRALFTNSFWEIPLILGLSALIAWYLRKRAHLFGHHKAGA